MKSYTNSDHVIKLKYNKQKQKSIITIYTLNQQNQNDYFMAQSSAYSHNDAVTKLWSNNVSEAEQRNN